MLGIVGDSGAGKTTLTRGLVRIVGSDRAGHVSGDHYLRFDRAQRTERGLTPLHPDASHLDILEQHLRHLRAGEWLAKCMASQIASWISALRAWVIVPEMTRIVSSFRSWATTPGPLRVLSGGRSQYDRPGRSVIRASRCSGSPRSPGIKETTMSACRR
jgi:ATPase subunit of ABC transporter with duplicated ATPase domains